MARFIEDRLEQLESGEHLAQFDSKVRFLKTDGVALDTPREPEDDDQVARLISLMEDLAKRMDGLDRKHRSLAEELRHRDRRDRRRRQAFAAVAVAVLTLAGGAWARARVGGNPVPASIAPE